jgi:hypothetical protein
MNASPTRKLIEPTKESLLKYITEKKDVTFVELQRDFSNMEGDVELSIHNETIVYWIGLSSEGARMIVDLKDEKKIEFEPVDALIYLMDGSRLKLPVLRKMPKKPLKTQRWLPITLNPIKEIK